MNYIPNSMADLLATADLAAPSPLADDPELQAKADQARRRTHGAGRSTEPLDRCAGHRHR